MTQVYEDALSACLDRYQDRFQERISYLNGLVNRASRIATVYNSVYTESGGNAQITNGLTRGGVGWDETGANLTDRALAGALIAGLGVFISGAFSPAVLTLVALDQIVQETITPLIERVTAATGVSEPTVLLLMQQAPSTYQEVTSTYENSAVALPAYTVYDGGLLNWFGPLDPIAATLLPHLRGRQQAALDNWRTYCQGQAAEASEQLDTQDPTPPAAPGATPTCPDGYQLVTRYNEILDEDVQVCEQIAVDVAPPPPAPEPDAPTDTTPPVTPTAPVAPLAPCPDGMERIQGSDDCVPECGENQFRNPQGVCEDNPTADPTCPEVTASSLAPAVALLPENVGADDANYRLRRRVAGRRFDETVKQQRNQAGDCQSFWPPPPQIAGYDASRNTTTGVITYTAVPETPDVTTPDFSIPSTQPACDAAGGNWNETLNACLPQPGFEWDNTRGAFVPVPTVDPTEVTDVPLGAGSWILFPDPGDFRYIAVGTIPGKDGIDYQATGYSTWARNTQSSTADLADVPADKVRALSDGISDADRASWCGPIFHNMFRVTGSPRGNLINGAPEELGSLNPFNVRAYRKADNTVLDPTAVSDAINLLITPVLDPTNRKLVWAKVERLDKNQDVQQGAFFGIAWNIQNVDLFVKYFEWRGFQTYRWAQSSYVLRAGETYPPNRLLLGGTEEQRVDRRNAYAAYSPLVRTYNANVVNLELTDEWVIEDGLTAAARLIRTHNGAPVLPYRKVTIVGFDSNAPNIELVRPGNWIHIRVVVEGTELNFSCNVQKVDESGEFGTSDTIVAECVISPVSSEHMTPLFRLSASEIGGRLATGDEVDYRLGF